MNIVELRKAVGVAAFVTLAATTLGAGGQQAPAAPAQPAAAAPATARPAGQAPPAAVQSRFPDIAGIWNGGTRARPINSETAPWGKDNFPVVNERAQAFMKVFDEAIAPKYDCVPSSSPAIQYDPYYMQVVQWPDRVVMRYEKDDQTRTIWLDGRKPTVQDYSLQGFSVGRYEGNALIVETDHFLFDITGFDDYNGIPSSTLKKVTEKYWKENGELKLTLTLEDPLFLRKPASYTTRWLPAAPGYQLEAWECDPESSRAPIKMMIPKYK
jgi:hypothetical protein